jgi:phenylalanyl-tRNA synthetase beta chain
MKLSREWLSDYIDLRDMSDDQLAQRFTDIGHAVESLENGVYDLEITTNRVDAMSHFGMARELAALLEKPLSGRQTSSPARTGETSAPGSKVRIRIDAPEMCARYTGVVIRGVRVKPSPEKIQRRLEAVGLRPINNVVDATNYAMLALGHPLHGFDLDKLVESTIIVRPGNKGEKMRSLDGEMREIDPDTVVIADARRAVALGGIIGGAESEIGSSTRNVLLECAWFTPSTIRRTARRLGIKTDASYRFERRVDPNDTVAAIEFTARCIVEWGGGAAEPVIDVVAKAIVPKTLTLRAATLQVASGGVVGLEYALKLFDRLGFAPRRIENGLQVAVPTHRGDIHEEADLIEEVLRFFGLNNIPAALPRLTTGDTRPNVLGDAEDAIRTTLAGCGLTEVINYSFIHEDYNPLFSDEKPVAITNALTANLGAMRLSLIPGLIESVAYNRSYGTRDGALFEVGRTYHRAGEGVREIRRAAMVLYGSVGEHWGDAKRAVDFFDLKGIVEQVAQRMHVDLSFAAAEVTWLRRGRAAMAMHDGRAIATLGVLATAILQRLGVKGEVLAAEIDIEALLAATGDWKMAPVARFPGVPMILAITHARDLEFGRVLDTIRSLNVPHLHEVGVRDRFTPEGEETVKTTLGMWYQAFDRSLTQEEVGQLHAHLAARVSQLLPVNVVSQENT